LEPYLADLNILVGVDGSTRRLLMVEIRVAVTDAARVHGLMRPSRRALRPLVGLVRRGREEKFAFVPSGNRGRWSR